MFQWVLIAILSGCTDPHKNVSFVEGIEDNSKHSLAAKKDITACVCICNSNRRRCKHKKVRRNCGGIIHILPAIEGGILDYHTKEEYLS